MKEKKIISHIVLGLLLLVIVSCRPSERGSDTSGTTALLTHFSPMTPADTLHFFTDINSDPVPEARKFPVSTLYNELDSTLFYQMGYMQDTAAMKTFAHSFFPLDAEHDAALLEIREGWYAFKYLLILDKSENQFTHVTPVCEFYGGDGGQVYSESWLFFEDPPRLLTRTSERSLQMGTEEDPDGVQENFYESARLQDWLGLEWREVPVVDTSRWVTDFSMDWW